MRTILIGAIALLGLDAVASQALALDPGSCDRYARTAIAQFHEVARIPGCLDRVGFAARWRPNYDDHYNWCLGASPREIRREVGIRDRTLDQCREGDGY